MVRRRNADDARRHPPLEGVGRLRPGTPPRSLHGAEGRHDAGDGRFRLRPPSGTEGCHRPYVCRHAAHLPPLHRRTARRGIRAAERLAQHHGVAHPGPHQIRQPAAHGAEPHGTRRNRRHAVGCGDLLGNSGLGIPRKKRSPTHETPPQIHTRRTGGDPRPADGIPLRPLPDGRHGAARGDDRYRSLPRHRPRRLRRMPRQFPAPQPPRTLGALHRRVARRVGGRRQAPSPQG